MGKSSSSRSKRGSKDSSRTDRRPNEDDESINQDVPSTTPSSRQHPSNVDDPGFYNPSRPSFTSETSSSYQPDNIASGQSRPSFANIYSEEPSEKYENSQATSRSDTVTNIGREKRRDSKRSSRSSGKDKKDDNYNDVELSRTDQGVNDQPDQRKRRRSSKSDKETSRAFDSHDAALPINQFPGEFPTTFTEPYRPPGLASEYYGDQGESVLFQPGVRPNVPNIIMTADQAHLQEATIEAKPPPEPSSMGKIGAAASFYAMDGEDETKGSVLSDINAKLDINKTNDYGSSPRSSPKPDERIPTSIGTAGRINSAPMAAGIGAAAEYFSGNIPMTNEAPVPQPGTYNTSNISGRIDQTSTTSIQNPSLPTSNVAMYGAAAAAGLAGAAIGAHYSQDQSANSPQYNQPANPQGTFVLGQNQSAFPQMQQKQRRKRRGPVGKFVDWFKDPQGVAEFEAYTEAIGVCKYCFDPTSSPADAPRKHHYHHRRVSSGSRHGSSTRVDKIYKYSSDEDRRRRSNASKVIAGGIAGYGAAKIGEAIYKQKYDFDDTYSVKSGRPSNNMKVSFQDDRRSDRKKHRSSTTEETKVETRRSERASRHEDETIQKSSKRRGSSSNSSPNRSNDRLRERDRVKSKSSKQYYSKRISPRHSYVDLNDTTSGVMGFTGFFSSPSANRRNGKNQKDFFRFSNASSSSSDADLAFGQGTVRRKSSLRGREKEKRRKDDGGLSTTAAIAGLAATGVALAAESDRRKNKGKDKNEAYSSTGRIDPRKRSNQISLQDHETTTDAENDGVWEDATEDDHTDSSIDTALAYGGRISARQSRESLTAKEGTSKWGWRWNNNSDKSKTDKKRRKSNEPESKFDGVTAGLVGAGVGVITADVLSKRSQNSSVPLQQLDPVPTSDTIRSKNGSTSQVAANSPISTRISDSVPLQQPQPITPISSTLYDQKAPHEDPYAQVSERRGDVRIRQRRRDSSPAKLPSFDSNLPESKNRDDEALAKEERRRLRREERERRKSTEEVVSSKKKQVEAEVVDPTSENRARQATIDARAAREAEIERELERLYEEDRQMREQRKRKEEDRKRNIESAGVTAAAATVGAGIVATALAGKDRRETESEDDIKPRRKSSLKKTKSGESSPQPELQQERIARMAAKIVRSKSSPSHEDYSTFFLPKEIAANVKEHNEQAEQREDLDAAVVEIIPGAKRLSKFDPFHYRPFGLTPEDDPSKYPWKVPMLDLIEATPPPSRVHSERGDSSPAFSAKSTDLNDIDDHIDRKTNSGSRVTWGDHDTYVYEVQTPEYETQGFITDLHKTTNSSSGPLQEGHTRSKLSQVETIGGDDVESIPPVEQMTKEQQEHLALGKDLEDLPKSGEIRTATSYNESGNNQSKIDDDPFIQQQIYQKPFAETVSDLGISDEHRTSHSIQDQKVDEKPRRDGTTARDLTDPKTKNMIDSEVSGSTNVFDYLVDKNVEHMPTASILGTAATGVLASEEEDRKKRNRSSETYQPKENDYNTEFSKPKRANTLDETMSDQMSNSKPEYTSDPEDWERSPDTKKKRKGKSDVMNEKSGRGKSKKDKIDTRSESSEPKSNEKKSSRRKSDPDMTVVDDEDDSRSISSTPAENGKKRKEKKASSGFFGGIFSSSRSDLSQSSKSSSKSSNSEVKDKANRAEDAERRKKRKSKDSDLASSVQQETPDTVGNSDGSPVEREQPTSHLPSTEDGFVSAEEDVKAKNDSSQQDQQSFLVKRPEMPSQMIMDMPTESDGVSGLNSERDISSKDQFATIDSIVDHSGGAISPHFESENAQSRPDLTPTSRRLSAIHTAGGFENNASGSSPTAVPLHFRRLPISPIGDKGSFSSPIASPISPRSRQNRPKSTEFRSSKEFRPLYLVEKRNWAKAVTPDEDETYPSLPSSRTSSAHPSIEDLRSELKMDESQGYFTIDRIDPTRLSEAKRRHSYSHWNDSGKGSRSPDYLDSRSATPVQSDIQSSAVHEKKKPKYEFHSPSELLQDPALHEELSEENREFQPTSPLPSVVSADYEQDHLSSRSRSPSPKQTDVENWPKRERSISSSLNDSRRNTITATGLGILDGPSLGFDAGTVMGQPKESSDDSGTYEQKRPKEAALESSIPDLHTIPSTENTSDQVQLLKNDIDVVDAEAEAGLSRANSKKSKKEKKDKKKKRKTLDWEGEEGTDKGPLVTEAEPEISRDIGNREPSLTSLEDTTTVPVTVDPDLDSSSYVLERDDTSWQSSVAKPDKKKKKSKKKESVLDLEISKPTSTEVVGNEKDAEEPLTAVTTQFPDSIKRDKDDPFVSSSDQTTIVSNSARELDMPQTVVGDHTSETNDINLLSETDSAFQGIQNAQKEDQVDDADLATSLSERASRTSFPWDDSDVKEVSEVNQKNVHEPVTEKGSNISNHANDRYEGPSIEEVNAPQNGLGAFEEAFERAVRARGLSQSSTREQAFETLLPERNNAPFIAKGDLTPIKEASKSSSSNEVAFTTPKFVDTTDNSKASDSKSIERSVIQPDPLKDYNDRAGQTTIANEMRLLAQENSKDIGSTDDHAMDGEVPETPSESADVSWAKSTKKSKKKSKKGNESALVEEPVTIEENQPVMIEINEQPQDKDFQEPWESSNTKKGKKSKKGKKKTTFDWNEEPPSDSANLDTTNVQSSDVMPNPIVAEPEKIDDLKPRGRNDEIDDQSTARELVSEKERLSTDQNVISETRDLSIDEANVLETSNKKRKKKNKASTFNWDDLDTQPDSTDLKDVITPGIESNAQIDIEDVDEERNNASMSIAPDTTIAETGPEGKLVQDENESGIPAQLSSHIDPFPEATLEDEAAQVPFSKSTKQGKKKTKKNKSLEAQELSNADKNIVSRSLDDETGDQPDLTTKDLSQPLSDPNNVIPENINFAEPQDLNKTTQSSEHEQLHSSNNAEPESTYMAQVSHSDQPAAIAKNLDYPSATILHNEPAHQDWLSNAKTLVSNFPPRPVNDVEDIQKSSMQFEPSKPVSIDEREVSDQVGGPQSLDEQTQNAEEFAEEPFFAITKKGKKRKKKDRQTFSLFADDEPEANSSTPATTDLTTQQDDRVISRSAHEPLDRSEDAFDSKGSVRNSQEDSSIEAEIPITDTAPVPDFANEPGTQRDVDEFSWNIGKKSKKEKRKSKKADIDMPDTIMTSNDVATPMEIDNVNEPANIPVLEDQDDFSYSADKKQNKKGKKKKKQSLQYLDDEGSTPIDQTSEDIFIKSTEKDIGEQESENRQDLESSSEVVQSAVNQAPLQDIQESQLQKQPEVDEYFNTRSEINKHPTTDMDLKPIDPENFDDTSLQDRVRDSHLKSTMGDTDQQSENRPGDYPSITDNLNEKYQNVDETRTSEPSNNDKSDLHGINEKQIDATGESVQENPTIREDAFYMPKISRKQSKKDKKKNRLPAYEDINDEPQPSERSVIDTVASANIPEVSTIVEPDVKTVDRSLETIDLEIPSATVENEEIQLSGKKKSKKDKKKKKNLALWEDEAETSNEPKQFEDDRLDEQDYFNSKDRDVSTLNQGTMNQEPPMEFDSLKMQEEETDVPNPFVRNLAKVGSQNSLEQVSSTIGRVPGAFDEDEYVDNAEYTNKRESPVIRDEVNTTEDQDLQRRKSKKDKKKKKTSMPLEEYDATETPSFEQRTGKQKVIEDKEIIDDAQHEHDSGSDVSKTTRERRKRRASPQTWTGEEPEDLPRNRPLTPSSRHEDIMETALGIAAGLGIGSNHTETSRELDAENKNNTQSSWSFANLMPTQSTSKKEINRDSGVQLNDSPNIAIDRLHGTRDSGFISSPQVPHTWDDHAKDTSLRAPRPLSPTSSTEDVRSSLRGTKSPPISHQVEPTRKVHQHLDTPTARHPSPIDPRTKDPSSNLFDSSPASITPQRPHIDTKELHAGPDLHRSPSIHGRHSREHLPSHSPGTHERRKSDGLASNLIDRAATSEVNRSIFADSNHQNNERPFSPTKHSLNPIPENSLDRHMSQNRGQSAKNRSSIDHNTAIAEAGATGAAWATATALTRKSSRDEPTTGRPRSRTSSQRNLRNPLNSPYHPNNFVSGSSTSLTDGKDLDQSASHPRDMADIYDGFGSMPGSPRSPTRPPSMRKRQSMQQIRDLEARVDQLANENRSLAEAKLLAEKHLEEVGIERSRNDPSFEQNSGNIDAELRERDDEIARLKEEVANLTSTHQALQDEHNQWQESNTELENLRSQHAELSSGMEDIVRHEIDAALVEKNAEIQRLYHDLELAKEKIRTLQATILARGEDDTVIIRDEDYFDNACQQLCQHVQQWVLRFSKFSDTRVCRSTNEVRHEKIVDRFDNAILDGSDVDVFLADRIKRRDVFMSVVMTMIWEYVFTRYLFGMDRDQRQKLKQLEKNLTEVGPTSAVRQWRALTLSLLTKREAFNEQREMDSEAVVLEIFTTLAKFLPPPKGMEQQIQDSLRNVMKAAVDLSIEMRTQRAEYIMLPPLQPEYDTNGDLARKVYFNASLMNERSGETTSNEELEQDEAVIRMVLFPLVVKKGDDGGNGDEEIVVCPAQVLVARTDKGKKVKSTRRVSNENDQSEQNIYENQRLQTGSNHSLGAMSGVESGSENMI